MVESTQKPSVRRWLILAGVSLTIFLEVGVLKSYGVFLNDITRDLDTTTGLVGLVSGLAQGITYLLAPVSRFLTKKLSVRQVIILGAIIGTSSYIMTSFSRSSWQFGVALLSSGMGYSMVTFPAHALPVRYFPDKFELASSIIMTAGGLGMMLLPVIAEQLNRIYGWRQAMLLLGAFSLHNIPIGALVKEEGSISGAKAPSKKDVKHRGKEYSSASVLQPLLESTSISHRENNPDEENHLRELSTAEAGIQSTESPNGVLKNIAPSVRPNPKTIVIEKETDGVKSTSQKSVWQSLKTLTGFDIVEKKPDVLSVIFAMFMLGMTYSGWIIFIVPNGIAKGYLLEHSILLATVGGAANIFGRFIIGFVSKLQLFSNNKLYVMLCFVSFVAYTMNILSTQFWALCILAVLNGSTLGAMTGMITLLSRDTAPDGDVEGVISLLLMALGGGLPVGGFAVGWFFDRSNSYDASFLLLGSVSLVSAFFLITPSIPDACRCVYQSVLNRCLNQSSRFRGTGER
ncbi:monocarboxylate transporter 14-like [Lytechinus variegatus]|uniref:monocarboxylate transporter 14-like n=1 Tax=Lytechinus variegatus TaxID=7654 RepID=UPI001BB1920E|nr:monocarboxylate transporter 14-like [Lytechinus variegatus]